MDALALLCTLHADGPATLVRLRSADCTTLEDVIATDVDTLAMLLRASRLAAGRFQKEARQLRERLGLVNDGASLESSESERILAAPTQARATAARNRAPTRAASAALAPETPKKSAPSPIDRVLSAWRAADAAEPVVKAAKSASEQIQVAAIDGMDADTAQVLADAGVRDLRALGAADPVALARATNLAFSKVSRLRALARRHTPEAAAIATPAIERLSPSERPEPPAEPVVRFERDFVLEPAAGDEGVGGPFA